MYSVFNQKYGCNIVTIYAGEYYVTKEQEIITTVLGSCVSVTLHDFKNRVSGMNHYMLPFSSSDSHIKTESSNRYGKTSLNNLLKDMEKLGAERKHIVAKIFGGGNVLPLNKSNNPNKESVGTMNVNFAKEFLNSHNITIQKEDTGDNSGRNLSFFTFSGRAFIKKISISDIKDLEEELINIS